MRGCAAGMERDGLLDGRESLMLERPRDELRVTILRVRLMRLIDNVQDGRVEEKMNE